MENLDQLAIENFQEYLRIPSVHPNISYDDSVRFLKKQAQILGLLVRVHHLSPTKPVVIMTLTGKEPELPSIMLNGHMDVVPVFENEWTHDPFGAEMDEHGNIYARGTQDMKSVSIQYLEAIRRLKKEKVVLKRTIHVSFVPDEEISGGIGMEAFTKTKEFKELNVGFALDEGGATFGEVFALFYGEKARWVLRIHCEGQPGHGSFLLDNTAGEKARIIIDKFYQLREQEKKMLDDDPSLTVGDVTTVNMTIMQGGVQSNVIPPGFIVTIDCRIARTVDLKDFEETLNKWCEEAGEDVWIEYEQKDPHTPVTDVDETNPFWVAFKKAFDNMSLKLKTQLMTGTTDGRYLRTIGIPTLGFSPMNNTPRLAHDHNEFLNKDIFLRGIEIYEKIITSIASVDDTNKK